MHYLFDQQDFDFTVAGLLARFEHNVAEFNQCTDIDDIQTNRLDALVAEQLNLLQKLLPLTMLPRSFHDRFTRIEILGPNGRKPENAI